MYCLMRFKVYNFVEDQVKAFEWGLKCLSSLITNNLSELNVSNLSEELLSTGTSSKSLNEFSINQLSIYLENWKVQLKNVISSSQNATSSHSERSILSQEMESPSNTAADILSNGISLLNRLYESYGDLCLKNLQDKEAIASFLMMDPPNAAKAIKAARGGSDWRLAMIISQRFEMSLPPELKPIRLAGDLVLEYRGGLEMSQNTDFDDLDMPLSDDNVSSGVRLARAIEASNMSVDFCKDSDTAVSILLLSRCWLQAVYLALNMGRNDLLVEDIASSIRDAGRVVLDGLKARPMRYKVLVASVETLWRDSDARMREVSQFDPLLAAEIIEHSREFEDVDNRSEYSALSNYSRASNISVQSGTSAVSILSNLTASSSISEASVSSSFSIEGLDHSLLSRGSKTSNRGGKLRRKEAYVEKRERKQERKRGGKSGKDFSGVKAETENCMELWRFAQIGTISKYIQDLSDALLILGTRIDLNLIKSIQKAMDEYVDVLSENISIIAPSYPLPWLQKRQMEVLMHFQSKEGEKLPSWRQRVVDGHSIWRSTRRSNFE